MKNSKLTGVIALTIASLSLTAGLVGCTAEAPAPAPTKAPLDITQPQETGTVAPSEAPDEQEEAEEQEAESGNEKAFEALNKYRSDFIISVPAEGSMTYTEGGVTVDCTGQEIAEGAELSAFDVLYTDKSKTEVESITCTWSGEALDDIFFGDN